MIRSFRGGVSSTIINSSSRKSNRFPIISSRNNGSILQHYHHHHLNRRNLSTKNNNNSNIQPKPQKNIAPEINIDPNGNTILHQKAARAAELHAELNELLDKQAKRRAEEMNKSFGSGFVDFVKKSKSELINIFAAFTCVLLAWQISNIRKGARKLLDDVGEKEIRMEKLKQILRVLSNDSFADRVVDVYEKKLEQSKLYDLEQKGKGWIFGMSSNNNRSSRNNKSVDDIATERESSNELLKNVIQSELSKAIGDLALSDYELEEKKLQSLQREMGIMENNNNKKKESSMMKATNMNNKKNSDHGKEEEESSLGGLEKVLAEVNQDANADAKVVKRKGFI